MNLEVMRGLNKRQADIIRALKKALAGAICGCGPYTDLVPHHHADSCPYRLEVSKVFGFKEDEEDEQE